MAFFSLCKCLSITFLLRVFSGSCLSVLGSVGTQILFLPFLQTKKKDARQVLAACA